MKNQSPAATLARKMAEGDLNEITDTEAALLAHGILKLEQQNARLVEALRYLVNLSNHPLFAEQNDLAIWDQRITEARALLAEIAQEGKS